MSVGVQLHDLIEAGTSLEPMGSLSARIAPAKDRRKLLAAIDALNGKHGKNTVYFASAQVGLDHAPMRIAFNRIPDFESER